MATRRRNAKTHPKPTGDDVVDTFTPPDRPDVSSGQDAGRTEVVDVFGKETVDTSEGSARDDRVDLDSATEGDARSMASEESGDAADVGGRESGRGADSAVRAARGSDAAADDGVGYSARVKKRIARERSLVNRERALREQTQRELAEERAARQAQDERIARLERQQTEITGNSGVKDLEAQITVLKPQLAAAMEGGETAKALDLQEKLADLRSQLAVLKYDLKQKQAAADAAAAGRTARGTETRTGVTEVIDNPQVRDLVNQFFKANRHWWNRSAFKDANADTITMDKEILGEITAGELDFEPYSDEHFEELAQRLHEAYPDLEIQDLEGQPYQFDDDEEDMNDSQGRRNGGNNGRQNGQRQSNARGAAPVRGMGQNGRKAPNEVELARQGRVQLDESDFATMRLFKMDVNDPVAKKYMAKEKMRSILTGARSQTGGNRS